MRRFTFIVLLLMLGSLAAQAQAPASQASPAPGTKVGVIDFRSALMDSDAGKKAQEDYAKEIEPAKSKFDKTQKEMVDLQTKLQNAKTDAEKSTISRDIDSKKIEFERAQQDAQRTSDDLQQRLLPPVAELVKRTVEAYAKENNLAVVVDPTTEPSNIVYRSPASDITAEIMRRMNAEYAKNPKLTAPASAPEKPPPAPPKP
jgi:Skp family chaperone for outer membrane proteins